MVLAAGHPILTVEDGVANLWRRKRRQAFRRRRRQEGGSGGCLLRRAPIHLDGTPDSTHVTERFRLDERIESGNHIERGNQLAARRCVLRSGRLLGIRAQEQIVHAA